MIASRVCGSATSFVAKVFGVLDIGNIVQSDCTYQVVSYEMELYVKPYLHIALLNPFELE
jgi:hypothetical protein